MTLNRPLAAFACLNGAMGVMVGAFAAHGAGPAIKALLTTGGHYQMVHALLALVCAAWPARSRVSDLAGWLASAGGLVFCVALALVSSAGLSMMGAVAPIGGMLMIAAWLLLGFAAFRSRFPTPDLDRSSAWLSPRPTRCVAPSIPRSNPTPRA